jgi:hypothetical protein
LVPPSFVTTPTDLTVILGQPALFTSLATGSEPLAYQWLRNDDVFPGKTDSTLTFAATTTNDIAAYRVIASNAAGSVTSAPVSLSILTPPSFVTTPTSQTVIAGQPATFTALASGSPTPTYAWFRNGSPIGGATLPTLNFTAASTNDAAAYLVVASNSAGSVTSAPVTLTVLVPPSITSQPASLTRNAGESATFEVAAVGSATLLFQWLKDAVEIPGANLARFEIPAVSAADAGRYTVRVQNPAGSIVSEPAVLTVGVVGNAAILAFGLETDPTIRIEGTPGARYRIEGSSGLDLWTTETEIVMAPSGFVNWPVPAPLDEVRLFRVISVP